jgi:hydroxyacylglutathione hydrolase
VRIETLTVGAFSSNCHILHRTGSHDALVVDPGGDADRIIAHLSEHRLRPAAYLLTHGHMDHVAALADVYAEFPAIIGLNHRDAAWAFTPANSWPPFYDTPLLPTRIECDWTEGQTFTDAGLIYSILETPGHSPGSVSFYFADEKLLFSGDVLFNGGIGRTDLPGGHAPTLLRSLHRLLELPDDTKVYSGHGPVTTIAHERRTNPFLKSTDWAR